MKPNRILLIGIVLSVLAVMSVAVILAQESTEEPPSEMTEVPSSFADNRINGDVFLGGLAIYCEDENGLTDGNTFQDGAITVWGPDGQKYITLTAAQLRGDEEIMQPPPTVDPMITPTPEATMDAEATMEPMTEPVLLASADTINGPLWFFRVGEDTFALQGYDNTGKFYTYTWTECAIGTLDAGAPPFISMDDMPEMTAEFTTEPTFAPTFEPTEEVTEAA